MLLYGSTVSSWQCKSASAFESVRMLCVKSMSGESGFQLAPSHPYLLSVENLK